MPFDSGVSVVSGQTRSVWCFPMGGQTRGVLRFPMCGQTRGYCVSRCAGRHGCIAFPDVRADTGVCPYGSTSIRLNVSTPIIASP